MKSLNFLAAVAIMAGTATTSVLAHENGASIAPIADAPHVALVSAESDRGLQEAVEALQRRATESRVSQPGSDANLSNERKHPASLLRHRIHNIRKHAEDHVLILGGPEAFSL